MLASRAGIRFHSTDVKALLVDRHGAVWIGSAGEGLIRYQDGKISYLGVTNGLAHDFVTALCEDAEGSLWIGTREGLSQLSDVRFPIFSAAEGMVGGSCHGLCASTNGGIWTANTEGLSWFDGSRFTNFSRQIGLSNWYVKRVYEARNGDVYFINANRTGNREVDVLSHGAMVARYSTREWPTALAEDGRGVVAAVGGQLFRVSRTNFVPFVYRDGKAPQFYWVRNLSGCGDGSLLVATVDGVFRIKEGVVEHWSMGDGLSDFDALCACADAVGTIWAGLRTGVARIKGRQVRNISEDDGLAANTIRAIVPDDLGNLWMYSSRGFLRVARRSLNDFADGKADRVEAWSSTDRSRSTRALRDMHGDRHAQRPRPRGGGPRQVRAAGVGGMRAHRQADAALAAASSHPGMQRVPGGEVRRTVIGSPLRRRVGHGAVGAGPGRGGGEQVGRAIRSGYPFRAPRRTFPDTVAERLHHRRRAAAQHYQDAEPGDRQTFLARQDVDAAQGQRQQHGVDDAAGRRGGRRRPRCGCARSPR